MKILINYIESEHIIPVFTDDLDLPKYFNEYNFGEGIF